VTEHSIIHKNRHRSFLVDDVVDIAIAEATIRIKAQQATYQLFLDKFTMIFFRVEVRADDDDRVLRRFMGRGSCKVDGFDAALTEASEWIVGACCDRSSLDEPAIPLTCSDLPRWMEVLARRVPGIADVSLGLLSMPGTHDSGAYTDAFSPGSDDEYRGSFGSDTRPILRRLDKMFFLPFPLRRTIRRWAQTQSLSLPDQLAAGVRYLDMRLDCVEREGAHAFYFVHSLRADPFATLLAQLTTFMQENRGEVVVLDCSHFYGMDGATKHLALLDLLASVVSEERMVPRQATLSLLSLRSLWSASATARLVVIYRSSLSRVATHRVAPYLWPSSSLPKLWPRAPTPTWLAASTLAQVAFDAGQPSLTPSTNLRSPAVTQYVVTPSDKDYARTSIVGAVTPGRHCLPSCPCMLNAAPPAPFLARLTPSLSTLLARLSPLLATAGSVSIFSLDFVDPSICLRIIGWNLTKLQDAGMLVEGASNAREKGRTRSRRRRRGQRRRTPVKGTSR